jgi:hypothetical protein
LTFEKSDESGYILVGGTFMGDIWISDLSPSGDIVWQRTYGGYDIDLLFGDVRRPVMEGISLPVKLNHLALAIMMVGF